MILRFLFNLLNSPHIIQRLAESRPIRRAAQLTAYALTKASIAGRDVRMNRLRGFRETFLKELKEGWKEGSRQIKK